MRWRHLDPRAEGPAHPPGGLGKRWAGAPLRPHDREHSFAMHFSEGLGGASMQDRGQRPRLQFGGYGRPVRAPCLQGVACRNNLRPSVVKRSGFNGMLLTCSSTLPRRSLRPPVRISGKGFVLLRAGYPTGSGRYVQIIGFNCGGWRHAARGRGEEAAHRISWGDIPRDWGGDAIAPIRRPVSLIGADLAAGV